MKGKGKIQATKSKRTSPKGPLFGLSVLFLTLYFSVLNGPAVAQLARSVEAVGMTVSDMDGSLEFFSKVLSFEKVSDVEVAGDEYERLQGVFGLRMRVVRMRLGDEFIELTEYLA